MEDFVALFTGMGIPAMIFLTLGLALIIVEAFVAGFGAFGICGIISLVVGVVLRIFDGTNIAQILYLLAMILILLGIVFLLAYLSLKKGFLSRTPIVQNGSAVPKEYSDPNYVYGNLLNKTGVAITECHPVGEAEIDGVRYNVISRDGFIIKGSNIVVVYVEGEDIFVKKAD